MRASINYIHIGSSVEAFQSRSACSLHEVLDFPKLGTWYARVAKSFNVPSLPRLFELIQSPKPHHASPSAHTVHTVLVTTLAGGDCRRRHAGHSKRVMPLSPIDAAADAAPAGHTSTTTTTTSTPATSTSLSSINAQYPHRAAQITALSTLLAVRHHATPPSSSLPPGPSSASTRTNARARPSPPPRRHRYSCCTAHAAPARRHCCAR